VTAAETHPLRDERQPSGYGPQRSKLSRWDPEGIPTTLAHAQGCAGDGCPAPARGPQRGPAGAPGGGDAADDVRDSSTAKRRVCARLTAAEHAAVAAAAARQQLRPADFAYRLLVAAAHAHTIQPPTTPAAPRRRRPYQPEHSRHRVCAYLLPEQFAAVRDAAIHAGLTPAGFSARLLVAAARIHDTHPGLGVALVTVTAESADDEAVAELAASRTELTRVGTNLNQIARVLNAGLLDPGLLADAAATLRGLDALRNRLASAIASVDSAALRIARR
jgi:hypothetical protein